MRVPRPLTTVSLSMNSMMMGGGDSTTLLVSPKILMLFIRMVWSQVGQTVSEITLVRSLDVWNDTRQYGSGGTTTWRYGNGRMGKQARVYTQNSKEEKKVIHTM